MELRFVARVGDPGFFYCGYFIEYRGRDLWGLGLAAGSLSIRCGEAAGPFHLSAAPVMADLRKQNLMKPPTRSFLLFLALS
ncbi:hypothetical protein [Pseudomonas huaxiensis]|uniref:hypothetical protein n=1 Tax=Pseudomonas huaxiensis TaxID=2213017 RepID=UPI00130098C1|nr:hypothetical protein [Pseudomonas huaxiensis]